MHKIQGIIREWSHTTHFRTQKKINKSALQIIATYDPRISHPWTCYYVHSIHVPLASCHHVAWAKSRLSWSTSCRMIWGAAASSLITWKSFLACLTGIYCSHRVLYRIHWMPTTICTVISSRQTHAASWDFRSGVKPIYWQQSGSRKHSYPSPQPYMKWERESQSIQSSLETRIPNWENCFW